MKYCKECDHLIDDEGNVCMDPAETDAILENNVIPNLVCADCTTRRRLLSMDMASAARVGNPVYNSRYE